MVDEIDHLRNFYGRFMDKFMLPAKRYLEFIQRHYLFISSAAFFIFTALCYLQSDSYFERFDIDFFIFGGFTDVYQVAISQHILGTLAFVFIISFACRLTIAAATEETEASGRSAILWHVASLLVMAVFSIFVFLTLTITGPEREAELLKLGVTARYDIHTEREQLRCQSIIGSTKDYIFLWDHHKATSSIIYRPTINKFELVVEIPPRKHLFVGRAREPSAEQIETHRLSKIRWSKHLLKTCNQKFEWESL